MEICLDYRRNGFGKIFFEKFEDVLKKQNVLAIKWPCPVQRSILSFHAWIAFPGLGHTSPFSQVFDCFKLEKLQGAYSFTPVPPAHSLHSLFRSLIRFAGSPEPVAQFARSAHKPDWPHGKSGSFPCTNAMSCPNSISPAPAFPNAQTTHKGLKQASFHPNQSLRSSAGTTHALCPSAFVR